MTKQIKNQSTNKHKINSRGFRKPTANNSMRSGQPQFNELVTLLGWIVSEFYSKIPGQEQCISYFLERLKNSFLSQGKKGFILTGKS